MSSFQNALANIVRNDNERQKVESATSLEEVYKVFAENGYTGQFEDFEKDMLKLFLVSEFSDQELNKVAGGANSKLNKFLASTLSALTLASPVMASNSTPGSTPESMTAKISANINPLIKKLKDLVNDNFLASLGIVGVIALSPVAIMMAAKGHGYLTGARRKFQKTIDYCLKNKGNQGNSADPQYVRMLKELIEDQIKQLEPITKEQQSGEASKLLAHFKLLRNELSKENVTIGTLGAVVSDRRFIPLLEHFKLGGSLQELGKTFRALPYEDDINQLKEELEKEKAAAAATNKALEDTIKKLQDDLAKAKNGQGGQAKAPAPAGKTQEELEAQLGAAIKLMDSSKKITDIISNIKRCANRGDTAEVAQLKAVLIDVFFNAFFENALTMEKYNKKDGTCFTLAQWLFGNRVVPGIDKLLGDLRSPRSEAKVVFQSHFSNMTPAYLCDLISYAISGYRTPGYKSEYSLPPIMQLYGAPLDGSGVATLPAYQQACELAKFAENNDPRMARIIANVQRFISTQRDAARSPKEVLTLYSGTLSLYSEQLLQELSIDFDPSNSTGQTYVSSRYAMYMIEHLMNICNNTRDILENIDTTRIQTKQYASKPSDTIERISGQLANIITQLRRHKDTCYQDAYFNLSDLHQSFNAASSWVNILSGAAKSHTDEYNTLVPYVDTQKQTAFKLNDVRTSARSGYKASEEADFFNRARHYNAIAYGQIPGDEQSVGEDRNYIQTFSDPANTSGGIVGYNERTQEMFIVYRGPANEGASVLDELALPKDVSTSDGGVRFKHKKVISPFLTRYNASQQSLGQAITRLKRRLASEDKAYGTIIVTGYHTGGALATLAIIDMLWNGDLITADDKGMLYLVTFDSPRVVSEDIYNELNSTAPEFLQRRAYRLWNNITGVSAFISGTVSGTKHVGQSIRFGGGIPQAAAPDASDAPAENPSGWDAFTDWMSNKWDKLKNARTTKVIVGTLTNAVSATGAALGLSKDYKGAELVNYYFKKGLDDYKANPAEAELYLEEKEHIQTDALPDEEVYIPQVVMPEASAPPLYGPIA